MTVDLWDALAFLGLAAMLTGAFAWHWPAGLIVTGWFMLGAYYYRERHLATRPPDGPRRD